MLEQTKKFSIHIRFRNNSLINYENDMKIMWTTDEGVYK